MKTLLLLLIAIRINYGYTTNENLFLLPLDNIKIQNGSTPYLQMEYGQEETVPKIDIINEIEMQVIGADIIQRCI